MKFFVVSTFMKATHVVRLHRYHFDGVLPDYDVVCKERLVRPEDPANPSAQLGIQVASTKVRRSLLQSFFEDLTHAMSSN